MGTFLSTNNDERHCCSRKPHKRSRREKTPKHDVRPQIKYMKAEEFLKRYPKDGKDWLLGQGEYGQVYKSGEYAVKVSSSKGKGPARDIIREMKFYSTVYHPCILSPVAWSYKDNVTYIAMPRGMDLREAYVGGKINIEEIVSDTLSAVAYLNELGIAHRDIKPENMIFHDDYAKIIDLGLARYATLLGDGKYYIQGVAYTEVYKDPEYVESVWNPINAETYALGKSYYDIIGHIDIFSNMYSFEADDPVDTEPTPPKITNTSHLNWLFTEAKKMNNLRKSTYQLIEDAPEELIVRTHFGEALDTPVVQFKDLCADSSWDIKPTMLRDLCAWLVNVPFNWSARTLFAGIHLINRTIQVIKNKKGKLEMFGVACMHLACIIFEPHIPQPSDWSHVTSVTFCDDLFDIVLDIIIASKCITAGHTPWDYASYAEDLPAMIDDMVRCQYDPSKTRKLFSSGSSKSISALELRSKCTKLNLVNVYEDIPYEEASFIHPVNMVTDPPGLHVLMDGPAGWSRLLMNFDERRLDSTVEPLAVQFHHISRLLYTRSILGDLKYDDAITIYAILRIEKDEFRSGVDKLFDFDWYNTHESILSSNPFIRNKKWSLNTPDQTHPNQTRKRKRPTK